MLNGLKRATPVIASLISVPCYAQSSDDRLEAAITMMAVVGFVEACDDIEADMAAVREALGNLNVTVEDLRDNKQSLLRTAIISDNLRRKKGENCRLAWEQFGPNGAALRGLVRTR